MTPTTLKQLSEVMCLITEINEQTELFGLFLSNKSMICIKVGETDYYYLPNHVYLDFDIASGSEENLQRELVKIKRTALRILREQNPTHYNLIKADYATHKTIKG